MTEPEHHLSAADEEFLREHAGVREATEEEMAELVARTTSRAAELRFSLPLPKVAVWLGVTEVDVLTMTAAGELYSHELAGDGPRWPAWQFAYGRPLPRLAAVVAAIPAGTHPTGVRTVMTTPSAALMWVLPLDEPIQPLIPEIPRSPATWLVDGGDLAPVLALLASAAVAI